MDLTRVMIVPNIPLFDSSEDFCVDLYLDKAFGSAILIIGYCKSHLLLHNFDSEYLKHNMKYYRTAKQLVGRIRPPKKEIYIEPKGNRMILMKIIEKVILHQTKKAERF